MPDAASPLRVEDLLAHREWVRRVAWALVRDEERARDLEQEVWVEALERPPAVRTSLRGWLAAALRHNLLNLRRGEERRRRRETAAARPEATPSPADLVARAESMGRVTRAVLDLEEPYRATVLLRFFEGLEPAAVAARQGVPVETVRTRLKRALAMLRERFDAGRGGREAWVASLVGLLRGPAEEPPTLPRAVGGTLALLGKVAMAKKTAAVVVGILLLAGATWYSTRPGGEDPGRAPGPRPAPGPAAPGPRRPDVASTAAPGAAAPAAAPGGSAAAPTAAPGGPPARRLRGRFAAFDPATAPPSLSVRAVEAEVAAEAGDVKAQGRADGTGVFDLDVSTLFAAGVPVSEFQVDVDAPDYVPATVRVPAGKRAAGADGTTVFPAEIRLLRAVPLTGRVQDEAERPVAGVAVGAFVLSGGAPGWQPVDHATTGPEGTFRLRLANRERHLLAACAVGWRPACGIAAAGESPVLVLAPGATVEGRVVRTGGEGIAAAEVEVLPEGVNANLWLEGNELAWEGGGISSCPAKAVADGEGRFRIGGLPPGRVHRLRCGGVPGAWVMSDALEATERPVTPPAERVELLVATGSLRLEVRAGGVAPSTGTVFVNSTTPEDEQTCTAVSLRADGTQEFLVRPGARCAVGVSVDGFERWEREVVAPPAGGGVALAAVLEPERPRGRTLVVTLQPPAGEAIESAAAELLDLGDDPESGWGRTVRCEGNRFALEGIEPGRYRLVVRAGGEWLGSDAPWLPAAAEVEVPVEGEASATLVLKRGGRLRVAARDAEGRNLAPHCTIQDASGARVRVNFVARSPGGNLAGGSYLHPEGASIVDPALPAGRYRLEMALDGYRTRGVEAEVRPGEITDVDVALERE